MTPLDFIIIGAQKSATTALYSYLSGHPEIAMPASKEAPFFDGADCGPDAWQAFARDRLPPPAGRLSGKASPQYMGHPLAASRIAALMPRTRLIAILRDPIERARSHHQMCRRREVEALDFEAAVAGLLEPGRLERARHAAPPRHRHGYEPERDYYLVWGEYGRILSRYLDHFPRAQLLLLTTGDLKQDPGAALDRVLAFLGLEPGFRPANLGQIVHRGGGAPLVSRTRRQSLLSIPPLRWVWHSLSEQRRETLRFWLDQKNVQRRAAAGPTLSPALESALRAHFAADIALLQSRFDLRLPWAAEYGVSRGSQLATTARLQNANPLP